ncbi:alkaline protease [Myriangium duriaei CBS 260.36]|uniref:Alkaline protease n=1 Tax=Myriangium duriaei CBS 260.36 TaxID=1168546 RepID=A0A9P4MDC9_9PEZI|nr:alkaline protease [Myriangium duriaei CBS 260.36]
MRHPDFHVSYIFDVYLITLKPGIDMSKHLGSVERLYSRCTRQGQTFRGIIQKYNFSGIQAYAAHFNDTDISQLEVHDDIEAIEPDQIAGPASLVTQSEASYALDQISHRAPRFTGQYVYDNSAGFEMYAYVVDSGIYRNHIEFEGRVSFGHNAVPKVDPEDRTGHGTHVAGIIGSRTYGVAKKCNLIAVKVLHRGETQNTLLLNGIIWAATDILNKRRQPRAVINVSITGGYSRLINKITDRAFERGITIAQTRSPGSADGAITVAATDWTRERCSWSNWGININLFAPGSRIRSTTIGNVRMVEERTGTSQASAYVAGLVIYFKRQHRLPNARSTMTYIMGTATHGVIKSNKASANLIAYNGSGR